MGLKRIAQISLIWVAISLTALSRSQTIPTIKYLGCFNDFKEKMFCFWEIVGSSSNCSEDFTLTYVNFQKTKETCPDLQNEQLDGSAVPNKCICNIARPFFISGEFYEIEVKSHGQPVGNTKIDINSTVKPRAPSNVQVEFQEEVNGLVQWNIGYEGNFIKTKLSFHVQILFKHGREVAKEDWLRRLEPRYQFSKRQLKRGEEYVVRVRSKPAENLGFQGSWSEWSSEANWKNDYRLTILDLKNVIIPITCIMSLGMIIATFVCLSRCKKKWWNNIPNPAKSKLAQSSLLQKQSFNPDGKSAKKVSCASFISRIVKAHKSRCDMLTQQQNAEGYVNICGGQYYKKVFFEPEDEDIERCEMFLIKKNENPAQKDKMELKVEDHLLELGDLSIARMFFDILCDSSGINVDTFESFNTGNSLGCSGWMDSFGKKEIHRCNSDISAYQESGYNSYGLHDSPIDFLDIDRLNTSYFCQLSDIEGDCIPKSPPSSVKDNCLYQKEEEHSESPGYNNFANILYAGKDFIIDTSKTSCLDNLSNIMLSKINSHKGLLTRKGNLYYNTKYFFSHEDRFQSIIKPKPEEVSELTLQSYKINCNPTSICHVSEYQSFDQAVQENDPEFGNHMSGYKGFDQAVLEGEPDSGCQVSGYQSFDQAVQQGDMTSVFQVTGYQSFDQAVQQNETPGSTNCSVVESEYKPLEDLIFQNSDYSVKDVSENDRQYNLGDSHCQNNIEYQQTKKLINGTDNNNNKAIHNSQKHELSFASTQLWLENFLNSTTEKYHPSKDFSDKSFEALKLEMDTYLDNDLAITHENVPLALTFDICEHLKNLKIMHGHWVPRNSLIFPCHLDDVELVQEKLTSNKKLTSQKCPSTKFDTFENLSYFFPFCEALGPNQQTRHLLVQQINVDKDGNSYMKLALP